MSSPWRGFLLGLAIGSVVTLGVVSLRRTTVARGEVTTNAEARLRELGLELPPVPVPVATYVPAVRSGNMLYVSGHGPRRADGGRWTGKVGAGIELEEARAAARSVGLTVLASARQTLGSLDEIVRVVKVLGMVNATPEFTQQPQVINGFSDLMVEVFGKEAGTAARSAVGVGSLPGGIPVEIEAIFEVRDGS